MEPGGYAEGYDFIYGNNFHEGLETYTDNISQADLQTLAIFKKQPNRSLAIWSHFGYFS